MQHFSLLLLLKRREKERREETQRDKALHRKHALGQHIRLEICNKRTRPLPSLYRRQRYRLRYAYFILSFLFSFSPPSKKTRHIKGACIPRHHTKQCKNTHTVYLAMVGARITSVEEIHANTRETSIFYMFSTLVLC